MLHSESSPHQGIYVPLSQAMTDSESEEEIQIHSTRKHRQLRQLQSKQQNQNHQTQLRNQYQEQTTLQQIQENRRNRSPPNSLVLKQKLPTPPKKQKQRLLMQQEQQIQQTNNQENLQHNQTFQSDLIANGHYPPSTYTTKMQTTFRSVMMTDLHSMHPDGPAGSNFSSFNSDYDERNHIDADNVAILGGSSSSSDLKHVAEAMSPARRCCFIASLLLCIFAVFGFVWLVPCREDGSCPAPLDRVKTHNWLNKYPKIELKGGVHIVSGLRQWENNLIFLYRGDMFFPEFGGGSNAKKNGIISLIGSSGAVAWYEEMVDEPVAIDCTLLDVDRNGRPDCLVMDECGQLSTINPISGQWHWRYKECSAHKVDALDFPVMLPDLDGDGVLELLFVSSGGNGDQRIKQHTRRGEASKGKGERNLLRIISGRLGTPIGEDYKIHDCQVLRKLQLEERAQTLSFNCLRNNTEAQRSKTLPELFALITNKSLMGQRKMVPTTAKIAQHRHYGQRKDIDAQRNIYSLSGRELVVENRGQCPEDCNVTVFLTESKDGQTKVHWNFTNLAMYGMVPTQWHFQHTHTKMSGFVMKLWKWRHLTDDHIGEKHRESEEEQPQKSEKFSNGAAAAKKVIKTNTLKESATKASKSNQTPSHYGKGNNNNNNNINNDNNSNKNHHRHKRTPTEHALPAEHDTFDVFEQSIQRRQTYSLPPHAHERVARSIDGSTKVQNSTTSKQLSAAAAAGSKLHLLDNYKMQMITETVILMLFIGAETHIENTSQSDIVQFCRRLPATAEGGRGELLCQPDLNNQENSMLIADLDQDGSQELVSYMSRFVQQGDTAQDWKLVTDVRLLRLESELPPFYEKKLLN